MKKIIFILVAALSLAACSNYGKKIKVEGTKGEVYYKGDGVTEADAKKTGEFLKEEFFSSGKEASVQITKEGEEFTIRFVYNKAVYDTLQGAEEAFKTIGAKASKELFGGKKVNIALANSSFKDFKTIPYDEATAKALEAPVNDEPLVTQKDFEHETMEGIDFYWRGIPDEDSKTIADYIVKNGSFSGGTAEIYMTKNDDRYILRFPMIESARTNPETLAAIAKVTKDIKENVFANEPFSFIVTDEKMNTVKTFDY
jgi:hypothetical protein